MRGAVSVALVASLPESEFKFTLETITFGVVLSSLVIQYLALNGYIKSAKKRNMIQEDSSSANDGKLAY
jgi:CPA1 family monovalent cation:H+ antiporter